MDRRATHEPILSALNLSGSEGSGPKFKKNVILDAEMVACHGTDIDGSSLRLSLTVIIHMPHFTRILENPQPY